MEDRYALLIDADNVSAKYIKPILDQLSKYGNVTYRANLRGLDEYLQFQLEGVLFKIPLRRFSNSAILTAMRQSPQ